MDQSGAKATKSGDNVATGVFPSHNLVESEVNIAPNNDQRSSTSDLDLAALSNPLKTYFPELESPTESTPAFEFKGVVQRPSSVAVPRPCLMVPSFVEAVEDLDLLDKFRVLGKKVALEVCHVLQPQVVTPRLSRRWLEPYTPPPRNKQVVRRFRLTVLDGVLAVCRRLRDGYLTDVIAIGEGCWVTAAALSADVRQAAYKERHVGEAERLELETTLTNLQHAILITPVTFPVRSYLPLLREYVPEIVCVVPPPKCNVLVVLPSHDASSSSGLECSRWILGSITETITLTGPAYRTNPVSPLPLYQLHVPSGSTGLVKAGPEKPPTLCAEAWAGSAGISQQLARLGFTVRAYENCPTDIAEHLPEGDISRPENQQELARLIMDRKLFSLHVAVDCRSWGTFQNLNKTTRTRDKPQGDGTSQTEEAGNQGMAIAVWLIVLCVTYGVFFSFEHPRPSRA